MRKLEKELQKELEGSKRIAVLGLGSEQRADDAAGILLVRRLQSVISVQPFESLACQGFEGGSTPENATGPICAFHPTHILLVDAADIGTSVGEYREIAAEELPSVTFCTPIVPLLPFVDDLNRATGAAVSVIGIQPGDLDSGHQITPGIEYGVTRLMHDLQTIMWECDLSCQGEAAPAGAPGQDTASRSRNRPLTRAPLPNVANPDAAPRSAGAA